MKFKIQGSIQKKKKNLLVEFQNFYKTLYAHGSLSKKKKKSRTGSKYRDNLGMTVVANSTHDAMINASQWMAGSHFHVPHPMLMPAVINSPFQCTLDAKQILNTRTINLKADQTWQSN